MRIRLLSDLHLEFHRDGGTEFFKRLPPGEQDLVVIAGDLAHYGLIHNAVELACRFWAGTPVVYVAGNHEYWGAKIGQVIPLMRNLCKKYENLHFLNNEIFEIKGRRILGTTLWFPHPGVFQPTDLLSIEFRRIDKIYEWIKLAGNSAVTFLDENVKLDDIVVTHHLPSYQCVASKFIGQPTNAFFVNPMAERIIYNNKPCLWLHGHTHTSSDEKVFDTRVVCNPLGLGSENPNFNEDLVIEV